MTNFYSNPYQLNEKFFNNSISLNHLVDNTDSPNFNNEFNQLPNLFQQDSSNLSTQKYPSLLNSVIQLTNTTNIIQNQEISFYGELASVLEKSNLNKNIDQSKVSLQKNNKTQDSYLDVLSQKKKLSFEQLKNYQTNHQQKNNKNRKLLDKFFGELDIKDNKSGMTLSPEKIAAPINNNFKNRYEGIIEKELDTVSIFQFYQIVKEIDEGKSATEIDVDQLSSNDPNQQIAAILTSDNFGFDSNYQTTGVFEFSPFSMILMTLVPGVIAIQKKSVIVELLFGENGRLDQILNSLGLKKPKVSDTAIFLHNRAVNHAKKLAKLAQAVDNEKFSKHEFLLFAKIKFCLHYNQNEYQGLKQNIKQFKDAIKVQKSYQTISQIESMCQGIKQKQFYDYVYQQMKHIDDLQTFHERINSKLSDILPHVKTEEGKYNLQNYTQELGYVCQNEFMLNLFSLFSQKQLEKFLILKYIDEVTDPLKGKDVIDFKALTCLVMVHYDDFEALGEMINITGKKSSPDIYARIIQYIILEERHQQSYDKFEQLMNVMGQWYPYYQSIMGIRDEYPQKEYTIPKEFTQEIPGIDLYHKYKNYLTDKKTGYTYIDFEEEMSIIPA